MEEEEEEEENISALRHEDDAKRPVQNVFLPLDLVLRIIPHLPSLVLFDFRRLCKAARQVALIALAHRPFFILQNKAPSPLCFLLPLDSPCSPLPCSFNLAKPSFRLLFASHNLLCLERRYPMLLDVCVCDIFRKWKIIIPPIVHPCLAPSLTRRIFLEDNNVGCLRVVGFRAEQCTIDAHEEAHAHQKFSPGYRIFVASETYLRMFDSHLNQWSGPVYFPTHLIQRGRYPKCFTTSDGNLILTFSLSFSFKVRALFKYEDQSFEVMELAFHPGFEVAGYPASAEVDASFNLKIQLPHVKECVGSSPEGGLVFQGLCKSDVDTPYGRKFSTRGGWHLHNYSRHLIRSFCHAYQGKVYALVMEKDKMHCSIQEAKFFHRPPTNSSKCHNIQQHDLSSEDVENDLHPDADTDFDCNHIFPGKVTLYTACIDTTKWTMKVSKEANTTACFDVFNNNGGTLSFMSG